MIHPAIIPVLRDREAARRRLIFIARCREQSRIAEYLHSWSARIGLHLLEIERPALPRPFLVRGLLRMQDLTVVIVEFRKSDTNQEWAVILGSRRIWFTGNDLDDAFRYAMQQELSVRQNGRLLLRRLLKKIQ